jgi:hypothetical protein
VVTFRYLRPRDGKSFQTTSPVNISTASVADCLVLGVRMKEAGDKIFVRYTE